MGLNVLLKGPKPDDTRYSGHHPALRNDLEQGVTLDDCMTLAYVMCLYAYREGNDDLLFAIYLCDYFMCYVFTCLYVYMYTGQGPMSGGPNNVYYIWYVVFWGTH